jgi:hypothetical protein
MYSNSDGKKDAGADGTNKKDSDGDYDMKNKNDGSSSDLEEVEEDTW